MITSTGSGILFEDRSTTTTPAQGALHAAWHKSARAGEQTSPPSTKREPLDERDSIETQSPPTACIHYSAIHVILSGVAAAILSGVNVGCLCLVSVVRGGRTGGSAEA